MKLIIQIFILIFIIILVVVGLYFYTLSKIEVEEINVNDLENLNLSSFTLRGDICLYNGGLIPIVVDRIDYKVILDYSGDELSDGVIDGRWVLPKQTAHFSFTKNINWVPSSQLALRLITPGETYATVKGTVYIFNFEIPFEKQIDLEEYVKQFVVRKVGETVEKATNIFNKLVEGFERFIE